MNKATKQQRDTAYAIWNDLDALVLAGSDKGYVVSNVDFYAVWGLINAVLNNEGWTEDAYSDWMNRLYEVWGEVKAKYAG